MIKIAKLINMYNIYLQKITNIKIKYVYILYNINTNLCNGIVTRC